ncbi:hypothetical protein B5X24_HaOG207645 [Helicoverpa armigera]|uniref:Uncharacterized protein n=1 Tax=Helicoverpa armigera TaxID=29058 RepID=A0A2W1BS68_HELAM|nr:hypothetical protein B5X24_HaOG207645 [Helicoverpa armigera]
MRKILIICKIICIGGVCGKRHKLYSLHPRAVNTNSVVLAPAALSSAVRRGSPDMYIILLYFCMCACAAAPRLARVVHRTHSVQRAAMMLHPYNINVGNTNI